MHFKGLYLNEVLLVIVIVELTMLVQQGITFLWRSDEKKMLWQIGLLFLVILRNLIEGLFNVPSASIGIPVSVQTFLGHFFGYIVGGYFPIYWYKTLGFKNLRLHAKYGPYLIIVPAVSVYLLFSGATESLRDLKLYIYILPISYVLFLLGFVIWGIYKQYKSNHDKVNLVEQALITGALAPYIFIPIMNIFFHQPQWVVEVVMNGGFLISNAFFIREVIKKSKKEHYERLDLVQSLTQKVKERTLELERKNEERVNAFVNIIHETKTPLTLVKNYMDDYVRNHKETPELNIITQNINKLSKNITNLFDTERFIKGHEVYQHDQITNFSQILQDNVVLFKQSFKDNIDISENVEEGVYIKADPSAINSIINNILENAIKFSGHNGEIEVKLSTVEQRIVFSIRDNGIGIPLDSQKKIFEPYFQINTRKKNFQGMGLGLPIVKNIVDSLKGQINVTSIPKIKTGTIVQIELNKCQCQDANMNVSSYSMPKINSFSLSELNITTKPYSPTKSSIFVIEDTKALVEYLHKKFSENYNVEYALNGSEALKKLRDLSVVPDIIIADIMMDVMDGFSFVKALHELESFKHIPVVFLTAKTTKEDKLKALKLGAVDFVQKPFSYQELIYKVDSILRNTHNQKIATHRAILSNLKVIDSKEVQIYEKVEERLDINYKIYRLTDTEIEVSKLVRDGLSNREIANTLFSSEGTIKKHMENMFKKTSTRRRAELVKKLEN